jgi:hypothetical protein
MSLVLVGVGGYWKIGGTIPVGATEKILRLQKTVLSKGIQNVESRDLFDRPLHF